MDGNERASLPNRASDLVAETLVLDRRSEKPLFQQVYEQIRDLIIDKSLQGNIALPSTRALAKDLRVARNTVMIAYEQLETEGYVTTARGARARVAELPDLRRRREHQCEDYGGRVALCIIDLVEEENGC